MNAATLERMLAALSARRPVIRLVDLTSGAERLLIEGDNDWPSAGGGLPADAVLATASMASRCVDAPAGRTFMHVLQPAARLIIVGAVHIAQPLARMAVVCGFDVSIIDPRRGFAGRPGFEGVEMIGDWPDDALARLAPDERTAIVTLTHDPKLDDPALDAALKSPAFYIGALGSRKTQAQRRDRLAGRGFGDGDLDRIHGPVGLAIGAVTPAEIAVSIIADITRVRRTETVS